MTQEELIAIGALNGMTQTSTLTIRLEANLNAGKKLADNGECKAVILRLNNFTRNLTSQVAPTYFYFGDNQRQEFEVLRGVNSDLIFCKNLNEVEVRCPFETEVNIQVMVFT